MAQRLELHNAEWTRVSNRLIISDYIGALFATVFFLAAVVVVAYFTVPEVRWAAIPVGVIALIGLVLVPRRVRALGYQLRTDDLLFRRGIMMQRFVAVPYGRMQLVDINRGPITRMLDLSELKFVTAAASTGVTIPGLRSADADALRDTLVALAETRRAGL